MDSPRKQSDIEVHQYFVQSAQVIREVSLFDNERYLPMSSWSSRALLPTDRASFSDEAGEFGWQSLQEAETPLLSSGWSWLGDWQIDNRPENVDAEGWSYAVNFSAEKEKWMKNKGIAHFVRRRKHTRRQVFDAEGMLPEGGNRSALTCSFCDSREVHSLSTLLLDHFTTLSVAKYPSKLIQLKAIKLKRAFNIALVSPEQTRRSTLVDSSAGEADGSGAADDAGAAGEGRNAAMHRQFSCESGRSAGSAESDASEISGRTVESVSSSVTILEPSDVSREITSRLNLLLDTIQTQKGSKGAGAALSVLGGSEDATAQETGVAPIGSEQKDGGTNRVPGKRRGSKARKEAASESNENAKDSKAAKVLDARVKAWEERRAEIDSDFFTRQEREEVARFLIRFLDRSNKYHCSLPQSRNAPPVGDTETSDSDGVAVGEDSGVCDQLNCKFAEVQCPNSHCPVVCSRKWMRWHDQKECVFKLVPCPNQCAYLVPRKFVQYHMKTDCSLRGVKCPLHRILGCCKDVVIPANEVDFYLGKKETEHLQRALLKVEEQSTEREQMKSRIAQLELELSQFQYHKSVPPQTGMLS